MTASLGNEGAAEIQTPAACLGGLGEAVRAGLVRSQQVKDIVAAGSEQVGDE